MSITYPISHNSNGVPDFTCPYCNSPVIPDAKTWRCDGSNNDKNTQHPFDVARQGYVNLLPVQHKKSKEPGDSQQSIDARHRFLAQGFYEPLQTKITQSITGVANSGVNTQGHWLDVGCGEGYYTQKVIDINTQSIKSLIALDISKPAVALLAREAKQQGHLWYQVESGIEDAKNNEKHNDSQLVVYPVVASAAKLPLDDDSVTGISSIFSPILPEEFARVLKTGGRLLIAKPDMEHLQTMREALFDEVRLHDSDKFLETLTPHFTLQQTHHIQNELNLTQQALADLLTMTPYSYRAKLNKREALLASTSPSQSSLVPPLKTANAEGSTPAIFKTEARFVVYELMKI